MKRGFTLIELLVVVGVFLAISSVVGGILFSALRGSEKATSLSEVRQNGSLALSVMGRTIRNAKSLLHSPGCPGNPPPSNPNSIKIIDENDNVFLFECQENAITLNSSNLLNTNLVSLVSGTCNFSCVQSGSNPAIVKIKFTLSQRSDWAQIIERSAQVDFETSITLRNK